MRKLSLLKLTKGQQVLASAIVLVLVTYLAYSLHREAIFFRYDGTFLLSVAKNQYDWLTNPWLLQIDPLKAVGDITFPTFMRAIPGYWIASLICGCAVDPVLSFSIFTIEFFLASCFFLVCLGARIRLSILASWIVCLLTLPYFIPTLTFTRLWGNPHLLTAIAWSLFACSLFESIGRKKLWLDACAGIAILILLALVCWTQPIAIVMAVPGCGAYFAFSFVRAKTNRERVLKLAVSLFVLIALIIIFGSYLWSLYAFTQVAYFWKDLEVVHMNWWEYSFFMHRHEAGGLTGLFFAAFCILTALVHSMKGRSQYRSVALLFLAFEGVLATTAFIGSLLPEWRGPPLGYFDLFALPLYGLFAALGVLAIFKFIGALVRRQTAREYHWTGTQVAATLILVLPLTALIDWRKPFDKPMFRNHDPFVWPPRATTLTEILAKEISLAPGQPFRGRVATISGAAGPNDVAFHNQHAYDAGNLFYVFNEHRMYGLWYFNIPTLTTSNQFMSPYYFLTTSRLLNPPRNVSTRVQIQITSFNKPVLERLGVRYVITDTPLAQEPDVLLRLKMKIVEGRDNYLYELTRSDTTGTSPTVIERSDTVRQMLDRVAAPNFDFRTTAVVDGAIEGPLVPASDMQINVERDAIRVTAKSEGRSIVVIPWEFSRCLVVSSAAGPVTSIRANLNETGLVFSDRLDVNIRFRFGPWINKDCRFADIADANRLRLSEVAGYWPH